MEKKYYRFGVLNPLFKTRKKTDEPKYLSLTYFESRYKEHFDMKIADLTREAKGNKTECKEICRATYLKEIGCYDS